MTRYTEEDNKKFIAEEEAHNAKETAAYFAWKRGETPLGTQPPQYHPPTDEPATDKTDSTRHLFDDIPGLDTPDDEFRTKENIDIDSIDVDDFSTEGREKKMKAMAGELEGFSLEQRNEAERTEEERFQENIKEGRKVLDHFGRRFEEPPKIRR